MNKTTTRVRAGGRVVIPAAVRAAVGLRDGDDVQVEVGAHGEIRLIPVERAAARGQDLLEPYLAAHPSLADELIAERAAAAPWLTGRRTTLQAAQAAQHQVGAGERHQAENY